MLPSSQFTLRQASAADFPAVLALNAQSVHFLSPLTPDRLDILHARAALHLVLEHQGTVAAFLLAFRENADYDSVNYTWFSQRLPRFLYIDRVVVDPQWRGTGLGRKLYEQVFAHARQHDVALVTCEFDIDPPNPASGQFHARLGFHEVGRQEAGGGKLVSLQMAEVTLVN